MEKLLEELKSLERSVLTEENRNPDLWNVHPGFRELRNHLANARVVLRLLNVKVQENKDKAKK